MEVNFLNYFQHTYPDLKQRVSAKFNKFSPLVFALALESHYNGITHADRRFCKQLCWTQRDLLKINIRNIPCRLYFWKGRSHRKLSISFLRSLLFLYTQQKCEKLKNRRILKTKKLVLIPRLRQYLVRQTTCFSAGTELGMLVTWPRQLNS